MAEMKLRDIAGEVQGLLRRFDAMAFFREQVRAAADAYFAREHQMEERRQARRNAIAKCGVWHGHQEMPKQPATDSEGRPATYFDWADTFTGRIQLPPEIKRPPELPRRPTPPSFMAEKPGPGEKRTRNEQAEMRAFHRALKHFQKEEAKCSPQWEKAMLPIFELAKKGGFPTDPDGFEYEFQVHGWLPEELAPDHDPATDGPLPVPKRALCLPEKCAALAAIYDAHWAGEEKIAPWGVYTAKEDVVPWLRNPAADPVRRAESRAAGWYYFLVRAAKGLDEADGSVVECWLKDAETCLEQLFGQPLGERAQCVLLYLLRVNATDVDSRRTTEDIAGNLVPSVDANSLKEVISNLKKHGFLSTQRGRTGGCWLTVAGTMRAQKM